MAHADKIKVINVVFDKWNGIIPEDPPTFKSDTNKIKFEQKLIVNDGYQRGIASTSFTKLTVIHTNLQKKLETSALALDTNRTKRLSEIWDVCCDASKHRVAFKEHQADNYLEEIPLDTATLQTEAPSIATKVKLRKALMDKWHEFESISDDSHENIPLDAATEPTTEAPSIVTKIKLRKALIDDLHQFEAGTKSIDRLKGKSFQLAREEKLRKAKYGQLIKLENLLLEMLEEFETTLQLLFVYEGFIFRNILTRAVERRSGNLEIIGVRHPMSTRSFTRSNDQTQFNVQKLNTFSNQLIGLNLNPLKQGSVFKGYADI